MKHYEWILAGLGVLYLMSRANAANSNYTYGQNPYAYSASEGPMGAPGSWDANAWNVLNGTPNYYLGTVPAQSPLDAYQAGAMSAPVGMF